MSEKICSWCGNNYTQGIDGCCRSCWEKNQFGKQEEEQDIEGEG